MIPDRDVLRFLDDQIAVTEDNLNDLYGLRNDIMSGFTGSNSRDRRPINTSRSIRQGSGFTFGNRGLRSGANRGRYFGDDDVQDVDTIGDQFGYIHDRLDRIEGGLRSLSSGYPGRTISTPGNVSGGSDRHIVGGSDSLSTDQLADVLEACMTNDNLHNADGSIILDSDQGKMLFAAGWVDSTGDVTDEAKKYVEFSEVVDDNPGGGGGRGRKGGQNKSDTSTRGRLVRKTNGE